MYETHDDTHKAIPIHTKASPQLQHREQCVGSFTLHRGFMNKGCQTAKAALSLLHTFILFLMAKIKFMLTHR